jgi:hypothetical protein
MNQIGLRLGVFPFKTDRIGFSIRNAPPIKEKEILLMTMLVAGLNQGLAGFTRLVHKPGAIHRKRGAQENFGGGRFIMVNKWLRNRRQLSWFPVHRLSSLEPLST